MKTLVILFADFRSLHLFDKLFDGRSAFERCLDWADSVSKINESETVVFASEQISRECEGAIEGCGKKLSVITSENWTISELFTKFAEVGKSSKADSIVFAWADLPFVNFEVTKELLSIHKDCKAEYTFADGYPDGLSPEVLDVGAACILSELSKNQKAELGAKQVTRTSVFDLIKTDINSFEVETLIADEDSRLFRVNFNCGTKANSIACTEMFKKGVDGKSVDLIAKEACSCVEVLKTVPGYYNIQLTDKCLGKKLYKPEEMETVEGNKFMELKEFKELVKKISLFSETAVVSLSAWGEAELHPDFVEMVKAVLSEPGLSVLIEGDLQNLTEEMCISIKEFADSVPSRIDGGANNPKIIWIVTLDTINGPKNAVELLQKYFAGSVYSQFVRMNENEAELEQFYRFWSDKTSPSGGNIIIQKFDNLCGTLPDRKPADLSPLERNPCWHIRRDMTVLVDGNVPFCRGHLKSNLIGNAFKDNLSEIWKKLDGEVKNHLENKYCGKCGSCDEYYTFNF